MSEQTDFATLSVDDVWLREWAAEGIALADDGFFVANERGPHVYRLDRDVQSIRAVRIEHRSDVYRSR